MWSLLGLINFYSSFVLKYADIVACLTELTAETSANNHIKWSTHHDEALKEIQRSLSSKPFLQIPNLLLDFYVFIDSSVIGIPGCLCQIYKNQYLTKPNLQAANCLQQNQDGWSKTKNVWLCVFASTNEVAICWAVIFMSAQIIVAFVFCLQEIFLGAEESTDSHSSWHNFHFQWFMCLQCIITWQIFS